jgi:hypothetical protein
MAYTYAKTYCIEFGCFNKPFVTLRLKEPVSYLYIAVCQRCFEKNFLKDIDSYKAINPWRDKTRALIWRYKNGKEFCKQ